MNQALLPLFDGGLNVIHKYCARKRESLGTRLQIQYILIFLHSLSPYILPHAEMEVRDTVEETPPNKAHLQHPVTDKDSGTDTLMEVSQSVPQSGDLSPALAKYKYYLQSCYNARGLAPADKYLPTLEAPYINLAMVSKELCSLEQKDEFTRQTLHGGVDQILQSKTPINIEHLLTPEEGGGPVRFVLVEGPPGIGKSTFAWEVCRRWDDIESLRDYNTVVLLKLREKWVLNAISPADLFRYPPDPDNSRVIAAALNDSCGENVLLVLDGFDEVSHSFHANSVIKSILCRQLLPKCTIILTTRPSAKHILESIFQPKVDKHVEIIGFTEEERVRYITEVFSKEPELQANFLKYMFLVPHIKSMMYIPLNCAIIAQVYYESQSSRHVTIPITRTQLYKGLTHSLLVRHMKIEEINFECTSTLPERLSKENKEMFMTLAKFAFDSYHALNLKGKSSKKVTFFQEDIPERLVHFGFMNESTEMYAGKGVERTFSFLHLSLQEYLAAWHLANSYSIEFQVAYHRLAVESGYRAFIKQEPVKYNGNSEEESLLASLESLEESLVEPAIFLAGITGCRCQSQDDRNPWEMYLSHEALHAAELLPQSFYEAQNPAIVPHYFSSERRRNIRIGLGSTSYSSYALFYCLAHSSDQFTLTIYVRDDTISDVETFVKGLNDHCKSTSPKIRCLNITAFNYSVEIATKSLHWIMKSNFLNELEEMELYKFKHFYNSLLHSFLLLLIKLQKFQIETYSISWKWLTSLKSLSKLRVLDISCSEKCSLLPPTDTLCWLVEHRLTEVLIDINFPSYTIYDIHSPTDVLVDSVLKSVLRSNTITKLILPNVSRDTMAGVHNILLHCPSLTTLELKRTRLGYDGILYICSALRNNTTLKELIVLDHLEMPEYKGYSLKAFKSTEIVPLPTKTTCTDFLLELNNILKDNTTLEVIKIQSGLFLPLSVSAGGYREYSQWTGLGPLQQFNVGAVASGMSPNLRRSFSLSDLTQPQTQLFWRIPLPGLKPYLKKEIDFKKLFSKRKEESKKSFSLPSVTASDTQVLQSFSGLDPRLKECLEICDLHQYVKRLRVTYNEIFHSIHIRMTRRKND